MPFVLHQPESLADAVGLGALYGARSRYVAGGTDLIVQINRKRIASEHVISLSSLDELVGIRESESTFTIGALTTHKAIERHEDFKVKIPMLCEAARVVGGHQIRNMGTIGGNIVNASPAADVVAPLRVLDAQVTLQGSSNARTLPLSEFIRGPGETDRTAEEVLTLVSFSKLPLNTGTAFLKAGRRRAMEISVVCVAAMVTLDPPQETCRAARIALGAVGRTALRCPASEEIITGQAITPEVLGAVSRQAALECSPISDVRASADYRRLMVIALVEKALQICVSRAKEVRP
jgi:carbon-monoxide dehydrogenase medium subunit